MKKQIKKLSLNKKTISNLNEVEMNKKVGGSTGCYPWNHKSNGCSKNANTCAGHNTCQYTCV
jgi:hypothetical protein